MMGTSGSPPSKRELVDELLGARAARNYQAVEVSGLSCTETEGAPHVAATLSSTCRLSARDALAVVDVLQRAIPAIERAHGGNMCALRDTQRLEARARRHGVTIDDLDADPDASF